MALLFVYFHKVFFSIQNLASKSTHSTHRSYPSTAFRTSARGMPFDKLKAPSTVEGLRVDTERRVLLQPEGWSLPSTRAQAEGAPSNVSIKMS